jgi:hypothetical protein
LLEAYGIVTKNNVPIDTEGPNKGSREGK